MVCIESVAVWQIPFNDTCTCEVDSLKDLSRYCANLGAWNLFGTSSEFKSICINFAARWLRAPMDPCTLQASFVRTWHRSHDASSHLASAARSGPQVMWISWILIDIFKYHTHNVYEYICMISICHIYYLHTISIRHTYTCHVINYNDVYTSWIYIYIYIDEDTTFMFVDIEIYFILIL